MVRASRPKTADAALNVLEHDWWNENAPVIARVWEMEPEVSRAVRGAYLERARAYFLKGRERATVLELGCGSGWVGQSIAGPQLRIVGADFSESQVALARGRAAKNGLAEFCTYRVATSAQWPDEARDADCALIHAFLHHLDEEEIDGVLHDLRTRLRPGARIFFYEPAFWDGGREGEDLEGGSLATLLRLTVQACVSALRIGSRLLGMRDQEIAVRFERLMQRAEENGWYLSPKEIPFGYRAFSERLGKDFAIRDAEWVTVYLVGWALECNLLRSPAARRFLCATFLPAAAWCDRMLAARSGFLATVLKPPSYAFAVWECEVPV